MGLFNFIECAVAQANLNRCGRELEKEEYRDVTMEEVATVAGVIKDIPLMGYEKAAAIHFGDDTPLTEKMEEVSEKSKEALKEMGFPSEWIDIASQMLAKLEYYKFSDDESAIKFLKSSGYTEEEIDIFHQAVIVLKNA